MPVLTFNILKVSILHKVKTDISSASRQQTPRIQIYAKRHRNARRLILNL